MSEYGYQGEGHSELEILRSIYEQQPYFADALASGRGRIEPVSYQEVEDQIGRAHV